MASHAEDNSIIGSTDTGCVNLLACARCGNDFKSVISEHMSRNKFIGISCEIVLMWILKKTFYDKSSLVEVLVYCRQATTFQIEIMIQKA